MRRGVRSSGIFISILTLLALLALPTAPAEAQNAADFCVVADASSVSGALPSADAIYQPTDVSVDDAGRVITSWFASTGAIGVGQDDVVVLGGVGGVVAHGTDGSTRAIASTTEEIDGRLLGRPFAVAVAANSGEIFVAERTGDDDRLLKRFASGEWTQVLRRGEIINTQPYTRAEDLSLMGNGTLYLTQSSIAPDWRRNRVLQVNGDQVSELAMGFQSLDGVAADLQSQPRSVWTVDSKGTRVYKVNAATSDIEGFDLRFIDGETVESVDEIGPLGDAALLSVVMEGGASRIVRLNADGSIDPVIDEQTRIDGLVVDSIVGLDIGANGDVYVADAGNSRVLRLMANPASVCSVALAPGIINLAASINCDTNTDIIDALFIVQFDVQVRTSYPTCPLPDPAKQINLTHADVNSDGEVDVIDALLIAQCEVAVANTICPFVG